jgi:UDP-glucuronate decarboxylase
LAGAERRLMSQRILLTGGTGFFGRALLRHLLASGIDLGTHICILSRQPDRFRAVYSDLASSDKISFVQGDIQDRDSLPWNQSFTHVLHAATDSTLGPSLTPLQRFNQIVDGTRHILDLAVATGATRFLLTSSGGIYGPQPADLEAIPEDWSGSPALDVAGTAYSQAKRAAEHLCALYRNAHGLETVIARCFAFVGPDLPVDAHFAIGNFIRDALEAEVITVAGDGTPLRTYLDQSDLARWLWLLLMEGHSGEAYNVGSDRVISISNLAFLVRDIIAPHKEVRIIGKPNGTLSRNRYVPKISKIEALHGLRAKVDLEDAIRITANAYSK